MYVSRAGMSLLLPEHSMLWYHEAVPTGCPPPPTPLLHAVPWPARPLAAPLLGTQIYPIVSVWCFSAPVRSAQMSPFSCLYSSTT